MVCTNARGIYSNPLAEHAIMSIIYFAKDGMCIICTLNFIRIVWLENDKMFQPPVGSICAPLVLFLVICNILKRMAKLYLLFPLVPRWKRNQKARIWQKYPVSEARGSTLGILGLVRRLLTFTLCRSFKWF